MYTITKFWCIAALAIIIVSSCSKDMDTTLQPIENIPEPVEKVFATIYGSITNQDNQPISGASVTLDNESTTSDINGYFKLSGLFNSTGAKMNVSKEGYFDGNGTVIPYLDQSVGTKMILLEKSNPDTGLSGSIIAHVNPNAMVEFAADSFTKDGVAYSGNVTVYSSYGVGSQENFTYVHPGIMEVANADSRSALRPFAVLNLELYDDDLNLLNISEPAQLSIDIDPALLSDSPDEISMWFLDINSGLWVEDGIAQKQGNQYVAEVNHFTIWACAIEYEVYTLSGNITRSGIAYPNANLGIALANSSNARRFRAASDGSYETLILEFSDYDFLVFDNCSEELNSEYIPEPTADVVLDADVTSTANSFDVSGVVYCDNVTDVISNSYVILKYDNSDFVDIILTDASGNFEFIYDDCNNQSAFLIAYDPTTSSLSAPNAITSSNTNLEIDVCGTVVTSSMTIKIAGEADYVIDGCLVQIIDVTFPLSFTYKFMATDLFSNSGTTGEFAKYEISFNQGIPGEVDPPLGPPWDPGTQPGALSANPPVYYKIDVPAGAITLETIEKVFWESDSISGNIITKRWVNGAEETVSGNIVIEAIIF